MEHWLLLISKLILSITLTVITTYRYYTVTQTVSLTTFSNIFADFDNSFTDIIDGKFDDSDSIANFLTSRTVKEFRKLVNI